MTDPISSRLPFQIADRSSLLSASSFGDSSLVATLAKVIAVVAIILVVILSFANTPTPVPLILFGIALVGFSGIFLYTRNRKTYLPPLFSPSPTYVPSPHPRSRFFSWMPSMPSWRRPTMRDTFPNTNTRTAHAAFGSDAPVYAPNSGFRNPSPYQSPTSSVSGTTSHAAFGSTTPVTVSSSSSSSVNQSAFSSTRGSSSRRRGHDGDGVTHAAFGSTTPVTVSSSSTSSVNQSTFSSTRGSSSRPQGDDGNGITHAAFGSRTGVKTLE